MFFLCQWTTFTAVFRIRSFTADACGGKTNRKGGGGSPLPLPPSPSSCSCSGCGIIIRQTPSAVNGVHLLPPPPDLITMERNGGWKGLPLPSAGLKRKKKREEKMEGSTSRGRASANTQPDTSQCPQFRPESSSELMSPFQLFKTRLGRFSMATAPITSP